ncbi:MAG: diacylglycerol kinase family lipid kinase [Aureibaculum sp.]|nr:diacylglycerol kinase family lipid kinase [Aureibaculum sp.]
MKNTWYIIINPTSGNAAANKKWNKIVTYLDLYKISYFATFSQYKHHESELVNDAIQKGYRKFISVGGDGTLHHIINGIMAQKLVEVKELKVAVIPIGTGNDWVKTYRIPKNIKNAVSIIAKENSIKQDIGHLQLLETTQSVFFNNVAGIGFDGFVVNNISKFKKYGVMAYLLGTITSFMHYKKTILIIKFKNQEISTKSLLTIVGICKYSGGGMQLTNNVNTRDGLFDISIAKDFKFLNMLLNIFNFFNGNIVKHKEVETYKTAEIQITAKDEKTFIQADGELIGRGGFYANIIPKAICFIIP